MNAQVCPTAVVVPLHRPWLERWILDLRAAWERRREHAQARHRLRALALLSDSTLNDIGLADRVAARRRPDMSLYDIERGRW